MKRSLFLASLILAAGCATTAPPATTPAPSTSDPGAFESWSGEVPLAEPLRIRVGLASDLARLEFPRIEGGYLLVSSDGSPRHTRRGFTLIAPRPDTVVVHGIQVASLADEKSASDLAGRIESAGHESLVVIDAATGLHKIFAGRFEERQGAVLLRETLIDAGYPSDMFVTRLPSTTDFETIIRAVDDENEELAFRTGSLIIVPAKGETIPILDARYRGAAIAHLNDRGLLNAINVLNIDDYVKGVVPNELGPSVYNQVEALKAQAMAARTYAIRRMGDFEREGYDICPTPACQVYEGYETEHELSNRAVEETAGMILTYGGEPIDALYTSTCGGETSDVSTMFPGRDEPYLSHVRCVENDFIELAGRRDSEPLDPMELQASLFRAITDVPDEGPWSAAAAERSVTAAARVAGYEVASGVSLDALRRSSILEYLGRALRFAELEDPLLLPEDVEYFFQGSEASEVAVGAAAFINKYRLGPAQLTLDAPMTRDELQAILFGWLEQQAAVRLERGKIVAADGSSITLESEGRRRSFTIPGETRLYRSLSEQAREQEIVHVLLSDRARVYHDRDGRARALIIDANYDGAAFDRTSSYSSWVRSYSAAELLESIRRRQPIDSVRDLVPISRDQAGRIEALDIVTNEGTRVRLEGIPIRWSLGVPDNLFSFVRTTDPAGNPRFTFWGKGWGHGTGMCQVGAFGMAVRGYTAEEIVKHFYSGIEIRRVE